VASRVRLSAGYDDSLAKASEGGQSVGAAFDHLDLVDDAFGVAVGRRLLEVAEQLLLPGADAFGERVERGESGMVDCEIERVEALLASARSLAW
jgi:hypothetical protein